MAKKSSLTVASSPKETLSGRREAAMSKAVMDAHKAGITDPREIRKRMLAASQALKDEG